MNYLQVLKQTTFNPKRFFYKYKTNNLKGSLIYLTMNFSLAWIVGYFVYMIRSAQLVPPFVAILWILTSLPLAIVTGLSIVGALHLLIKILGGRGTFNQSLQIFCYSFAPFILVSLPIVNILAIIYQLYLLVLGFKTIHQLPIIKAALGISILTGLGVLIGVLLELIRF